MAEQKLRTLDQVWYIVHGEDPSYKAFSGTVLGHQGNGVVTRLKVPAGENYAEQPNGGFVISNGVSYFEDVPHGDPTQGNTFVFANELPALFPRG